MNLIRGILIVVIVSAFAPRIAAEALSQFAYRQLSLHFEGVDGKPITGASCYGFCPELNLVWPRRDHEVKGRNDIVWQKSFLGTTDKDGNARLELPPGHWRFFAAGLTSDGTVAAAWIDSREVSAGELIKLSPAVSKHWSFRSAQNQPLSPQRVLIKPDGFPIWIPIALHDPTKDLSLSVSSGRFQIWADADATRDRPGFALDFGTLSDKTADGNLTPISAKPATLECVGGGGHAVLTWARRENFGLGGELTIADGAKVFLSPGNFTLAYRRPIGSGLTASFVGQLYTFESDSTVHLDFSTPLSAGIDQAFSQKSPRLVGQLYLVDGNGHLMGGLFDASQKPVQFDAAVTVGGQRFPTHVLRKRLAPTEREEADDTDDSAGDEPSPFAPLSRQTMFSANTGSITSDADAVWEITAPPGILPGNKLAADKRVTVASASFKMGVPQVLQRDAVNVLKQADAMVGAMEQASDRRRRHSPTTITIFPPAVGAVSSHDGTATRIGTQFFFSDEPMQAHTFVHEMGHNFDFYHGGLHESVVEVTRCAGGEQISQQPDKWIFLDKMNGLQSHVETPHYPNIGLYLYCYAQGGLKFLHFMSLNEPVVLKNLADRYTKDELTCALCSAGMGRDMSAICRQYGLTTPPDHLAAVTHDVTRLVHPAN